MTRKRLRQFENLKAELREEGDRLRAMERADAVRCATIAAYALCDDPAEETARRARALRRKRERYARELRVLERFIDRCDDSQVRRAMRLHYLEGYSWEAVAVRMHYAGESGARMAVERYLARLS